MHLSLHVIAESVSGVEVVRCENRRGIAEVSRLRDEPRNNVLYVASTEELCVSALPRHLLLAGDDTPPEELASVPNLAVCRGCTPETVFAEVAAAFVALSNWDSRMLEAIAARQGISAVLDIAAERLTNPIALFDSKQALLSYAGNITSDVAGTIWDDVLLKGFSPIEFFTREEQQRIDRLFVKPWPFRIRPERNPEHDYLCEAIVVDRRVVGTIGQVDVNAPFTSGQEALADLICDRLQIALAMRLGNGPGEDDSTYLLRSILNGNKADKGLVSHHLKMNGWNEGLRFRLFAMPLPEGTQSSVGTDNRLSRISKALRQSIVILYEGNVVALVPDDYDIADGRFRSLLDKLEMGYIASEPFSDIADARIAYEQCLLAIQVTGGEAGPIRFADAFEKVLPTTLEQGASPRALCDGTIHELVERGYKGDIERGRSLVRELYVYLMRGCNSREAARELFLHRNTLIYHIELLEKLLGVKIDELSCARTLFLQVSCLVALEV